MTPKGSSKEVQIIAKLENEVRNGLHSVMGTLELIGQGPLTPAQSDYLRACKASTDHLLRSVQNVSIFCSSETEDARVSLFSLHEAMSDLMNLMEPLARRKGLALSCEIRPGVPNRLLGDRDRLQDILIRLLDNAIRFTGQGKIQLILAEVPQNSPEHQIQFQICDTGPGIPADVINRLSNALSEHSLAEGLGLPIVRKLVLNMAGDLSIDSENGVGSRVTVSLAFQPATDDSIKAVVPSGATVPLNILVAEDSDDSFYLLEYYLRQREHHLTRAVNGARAVELFKTGNYNLVLMDIHMPDMDGYSAARAIRMWETGLARARVPIIVLSSDSSATQLQNGAKVGCSGYLTKPVSRGALISVLDRYAAWTERHGLD